METQQRIRFAGLACLAGGILQIIFGILYLLANGAATEKSSPPALLVLFGIVALCLMGAPLGLLALRATGSGVVGVIGKIGLVITMLGLLSYITGMGYILLNPAQEYNQNFTPAGAVLESLGMLLVGIAVVSAKRLRGWRRFAPLFVPLYYALMLPVQIVLFIGSGLPPSLPLIGLWGSMWILVGLAIRSSAAEVERVLHPGIAR